MTPTEIIGQEAVDKLKDAGYVVVPVEPTIMMIGAGWRRFDKFATPENRCVNMYRAMIKAAEA